MIISIFVSETELNYYMNCNDVTLKVNLKDAVFINAAAERVFIQTHHRRALCSFGPTGEL